jgi:hypothetical protein
MTQKGGVPLSVPLSHVLAGMTAELEAEKGNAPSLVLWSTVVRCVGDGIDDAALPDAARISSRFATTAVKAAVRGGWITAESIKAAKKAQRLRRTDAGEEGAAIWSERLALLDARWASTPLRKTLEQLVGALPLELPHFPVSYGTADPSAIGGPYGQTVKRTEGVPAHGNDWKPVVRGAGDTVSDLPLTALLSQVLMAFTVDYEDRFPWPLANTMNVLSHLSEKPRPLDELPEGHGIAGNGKSLTERHLVASVTKDGKRNLVALTERGALVMTHHPKRLEAVENDWTQRFGAKLMTELRGALGDAGATFPGSYPDHLIVSMP